MTSEADPHRAPPSAPPLFRREVLHARSERMEGSISIATPVAWQLIGFLLLAILCSVGLFLGLASYSKVQTATGTIELDRGVANILPSRPGVLAAVAVHEGQRVRRGQILASIRSEETLYGGENVSDRVSASLRQQDSHLAEQTTLAMRAAGEDSARLSERISGTVAEIAAIEDQIRDQQRLVDAAFTDFENVRNVATQGFISRTSLNDREALLVSRRQQLAQLRQQLAVKNAAVLEGRRDIERSRSAARSQVAATRSDRAALQQQMAQSDLSRGYEIASPVDGTVTALVVRAGQAVGGGAPLMTVIPDGAVPRAELRVPPSAIAFVAVGQEVRLAVSAFPYDRFGTVPGRISSVSRTTVRGSGREADEGAYLVVVAVPRARVHAFGGEQRLEPGMTLTAQIVTDRRSLFQWLFEPLLAARDR